MALTNIDHLIPGAGGHVVKVFPSLRRVSNFEVEIPVLAGFEFAVSGDGPYTLTVKSKDRSAIITVEDDKFPAAAWETLMAKYLQENV